MKRKQNYLIGQSQLSFIDHPVYDKKYRETTDLLQPPRTENRLFQFTSGHQYSSWSSFHIYLVTVK